MQELSRLTDLAFLKSHQCLYIMKSVTYIPFMALVANLVPALPTGAIEQTLLFKDKLGDVHRLV